MNILVVGGGGREHALVWKLARSPRVDRVFCAPGNAGIEAQAECVPIGAEDLDGLVALARQKRIDLTVVGPEAPLTMGLADRMVEAGIAVSGASQAAARIEGSKTFAKDLMKKYHVPTGDYRAFEAYGPARSFIEKTGGPLVVKADGLAAGKGVLLCRTTEEALAALDQVMKARAFGLAGDRVVVEEFLEGEEASFLVFTDGRTVRPLPTSQDHKAIYDHDQGPNTGGMGAYSPAPVVTPSLNDEIMDRVMRPTVKAMAAEGCPYQGVLYAGLMIGSKGIQVLEFNARFGDPECQPLILKLESDLVDVLEAIPQGRLDQVDIAWNDAASLCLVLASRGYPGAYEKGLPIEGLEAAARQEGVVVFHAGTATKDGRIVTSGGRVLGVTALGRDVAQARERAYAAAELIRWPGKYARTDIGMKALARAKETSL
jgi:phosphoribosylamine--glycine ligase